MTPWNIDVISWLSSYLRRCQIDHFVPVKIQNTISILPFLNENLVTPSGHSCRQIESLLLSLHPEGPESSLILLWDPEVLCFFCPSGCTTKKMNQAWSCNSLPTFLNVLMNSANCVYVFAYPWSRSAFSWALGIVKPHYWVWHLHGHKCPLVTGDQCKELYFGHSLCVLW